MKVMSAPHTVRAGIAAALGGSCSAYSQGSSLLWLNSSALLRHSQPQAAELGWELGLHPTWMALGDAQTKQLYIPRWQCSPVPFLAHRLGMLPTGALGNNLVHVYSHVLYCKFTYCKTDLAWCLQAAGHLSRCLLNYCASLRWLRQASIRLPAPSGVLVCAQALGASSLSHGTSVVGAGYTAVTPTCKDLQLCSVPREDVTAHSFQLVVWVPFEALVHHSSSGDSPAEVTGGILTNMPRAQCCFPASAFPSECKSSPFSTRQILL